MVLTHLHNSTISSQVSTLSFKDAVGKYPVWRVSHVLKNEETKLIKVWGTRAGTQGGDQFKPSYLGTVRASLAVAIVLSPNPLKDSNDVFDFFAKNPELPRPLIAKATMSDFVSTAPYMEIFPHDESFLPLDEMRHFVFEQTDEGNASIDELYKSPTCAMVSRVLEELQVEPRHFQEYLKDEKESTLFRGHSSLPALLGMHSRTELAETASPQMAPPQAGPSQAAAQYNDASTALSTCTQQLLTGALNGSAYGSSVQGFPSAQDLYDWSEGQRFNRKGYSNSRSKKDRS